MSKLKLKPEVPLARVNFYMATVSPPSGIDARASIINDKENHRGVMKLLPPHLPPIVTMERMQLPFSANDLLWRYPIISPSSAMPPAPGPPLSELKSHLPAALTPDPRLWNREDVATFLKWCEREFDLPNFDMEMFQMNGKALCLLTKNDLGERCPGVGDVLHNVLQMLVRDSSLLGRCLPSSPITPTSRGPYPLSPHSHPPTPNWNLLAQPSMESTFQQVKQAANIAHFINQSNSVTLSPAPSIDSQSGSPQHIESGTAANYVQTMYGNGASGGSSGSNQSDSDEDSYQDNAQSVNVPHSVAQSTPPTTPSYPVAPLCLLPPPQPRSPKEPSTPSHTTGAQNPPLTPGGSNSFKTMTREFFPNDMPESSTNGRLLWDFLQQLLNDPTQRYTNYIAWKNHESGVFKIVDPAGLAKLWGIQKNHLSMNYDKMSRALRYYYRVNILRKVQGERHCYQFLRNPTELKSIKNISLLRQQMSPTRVPTQVNQPSPISLTIKSEPKTEEEQTHFPWNQPVQDDDMPTDLSMPADFQSRKRSHPDSPKLSTLSDKHRISMIVGENLQKLSREREQHFSSANIKHEDSHQ